MLLNKRSHLIEKHAHLNEKHAHRNEKWPPLTATRESLHAAMKTQLSQEWISKINKFVERKVCERLDFLMVQHFFLNIHKAKMPFFFWKIIDNSAILDVQFNDF